MNVRIAQTGHQKFAAAVNDLKTVSDFSRAAFLDFPDIADFQINVALLLNARRFHRNDADAANDDILSRKIDGANRADDQCAEKLENF